MEKLKMHSPNLTQENIARIRELFPGCVTEVKAESGRMKDEKDSAFSPHPSSLRYAIDFDLLRQELSGHIVEGPQERYHLNWPGKREALLTANTPIAKTLRPCREESVDFDTTKNLFIEGDNLDALKLLQETYLGKVKMIYIDPPYNTGNDFIYEDDFAENTESFLLKSNQKDASGNRLVANTEANGRFHSDWLSMMYPRLKLARNLLRDDGIIFISIDDGEAGSIRELCDEIFGADNFVANVIWEKKYAPSNDAKWFSDNHDHIFVYAKVKEKWYPKLLPRTDEQNNRYTNRDNDPRGPWKSSDLSVKSYSEAYDFPITTPSGRIVNPPHGACWRVSKEKFAEMVSDNRIWFGENGENVPSIKRFLTDVKDGIVPLTIWNFKDVGHNQVGRQELKTLFDGKGFFDGPKPVKLLLRILYLSNLEKDDIVLDFFAGSSSTAHAVMQLNAEDGGNRKFIMVQLPEPCDEKSEAFKAGYKTIAEISKERIRRAGKKILEGECHEGWNKDIGFRVLKIDSSNMADVYYTPDAIEQGQLKIFTDNIKPDRKPEDLLFQVLLDWGVDLTLPIAKKIVRVKKDEGGRIKDENSTSSAFSPHPSSFEEFEVYIVDENSLIACFDTGVNEDLVKELARFEPLRVVFRDTGFVSDAVKINVEQIFKQMSPGTEVKSI
ncbi:site-specific DNA-methyltransferase [Chlorobaculum sp. MV4-Y]|uniref:site-specific DNA-methyltransferase n=1 Tax=Chlorobaculum sp. MV4-Y TaxID=2976335 RepID=UPI0021AE5CA6|nr:site-specific DNA-methyltransferase [Chlorobaculum sp. MV4-Y]UWX57517.1 site-specific DNA-methyltransferase [Chlorobaculum sp. MV4-Y]